MSQKKDHTGKLIRGFLILGQATTPGNPWRASCSKCGKINLMPRRYLNKMERRGGQCRHCGFKTDCWSEK